MSVEGISQPPQQSRTLTPIPCSIIYAHLSKLHTLQWTPTLNDEVVRTWKRSSPTLKYTTICTVIPIKKSEGQLLVGESNPVPYEYEPTCQPLNRDA